VKNAHMEHKKVDHKKGLKLNKREQRN